MGLLKRFLNLQVVTIALDPPEVESNDLLIETSGTSNPVPGTLTGAYINVFSLRTDFHVTIPEDNIQDSKGQTQTPVLTSCKTYEPDQEPEWHSHLNLKSNPKN